MLISLNWLKQYVDIKESTEEIKDTLTMIGQEVEAITFLGKDLDNVVTGQIIKHDKHPKSDKLTVLMVNIGTKEPLQIVCGAPNHKLGDKVVVAKIGAVLPGNFKIKKSIKREVESCGMLCSEAELGTGKDKSGIIILPEYAPIGVEYREFANINDVIFELEITPNRPDCLSHIGIAREIAAYYKRKLKYPPIFFTETVTPTTSVANVKLEDSERCRKYMGFVIKNVTVKESPEWLKTRIRAMGANPINNIVDITNFVMFEYNQPLHAFDLDKLDNRTVVIRKAKKGEKILTLDGIDRVLIDEELVIADDDKPIAIAGIIGGKATQIDNNTKNIFLEAAYFEPENIRYTAKKLGISTDASYRNERGTDIENIEESGKRAASLIVEIANGDVLSKPISKISRLIDNINPLEIQIDLKKLNKFTGKDLNYDTIAKIILSLGIAIKNASQEKITVIPPSYREDLKIPADIYEEVIRMYGFKNIEPRIPVENIKSGVKDETIAFADMTKKILKNIGLQEVINYSFISKKAIEIFHNDNNYIEIKNPLSSDMSIMRPSLLYSVLGNIRDNLNRNFSDLRFFEVSKVFTKAEELANEELRACIAVAGKSERSIWDSKPKPYDFYKLKGYVTKFLSYLGIKKFILERSKNINYHPGKSADIKIGKDLICTFGQIHPDILENMDIKRELAYVADINLHVLKKYVDLRIKFESIVKYPEVTRDLAIVVSSNVVIGDMVRDIKKSSSLIEKIDIFDIYRGENIGADKISVAFDIVLRNKEKTLEEKEINATIDNVLKIISKNYNGEIRQ
ncbi:MAG: phenylalanine--tRNA ligase subunit beta [Fusobacteriaceae bacterium]|jgi:phenylalanyl-tRNA synthetase beta chain|nr:phenylalanine--tRNA ligase subunit beta [Fusobacteriaceae bacterium]